MWIWPLAMSNDFNVRKLTQSLIVNSNSFYLSLKVNANYEFSLFFYESIIFLKQLLQPLISLNSTSRITLGPKMNWIYFCSNLYLPFSEQIFYSNLLPCLTFSRWNQDQELFIIPSFKSVLNSFVVYPSSCHDGP